MKANLLLLTLFSLTSTLYATQVLNVNGGDRINYAAYTDAEGSANPFKNSLITNTNQEVTPAQSDKDMKIANLQKLLEQQQVMYDDKIAYLQDELKKSKERLIEKSINTEKLQANIEKRANEETTYLKKELVAKTKTLMEYQRQLEKVKLPDEMKNMLKINTELAVELRRSNDQLAIVQLQAKEAVAVKEAPSQESIKRAPASVEKK